MPRLLLITTRDDDAVMNEEVSAVLRHGGLDESSVRHVRGEREQLEPALLDGVDAVLVMGSPFTGIDPIEQKSPTQVRVEEQLQRMLDAVIADDVPFLGACYGISTLGRHEGAVLDRRYAEEPGAIRVSLTPAGRSDALFGGLPEVFDAFVGHKEAISSLPPHAVLLATGEACPVQAFRIGEHQYATQFHPELDPDGLIGRVTLYRDAGYFPPAQLEDIIQSVRDVDVSAAHALLTRFVARYV